MTLRQQTTSRHPTVGLSETGKRIRVKCGTGNRGSVRRQVLVLEGNFGHIRPTDASVNINFERHFIKFSKRVYRGRNKDIQYRQNTIDLLYSTTFGLHVSTA